MKTPIRWQLVGKVNQMLERRKQNRDTMNTNSLDAETNDKLKKAKLGNGTVKAEQHDSNRKPFQGELVMKDEERMEPIPSKNGTIVVVAYDSQPLRWAYLPEGATRLDVESAFTQGYRWYKSVDFQATIWKDTKIIDHWRFTVLPAAVTHGG